jgi:hypothetical protein
MYGIIGLISAVLQLYSYVVYLRGIFKGEVKPHVFTWLLWGLLGSISLAAQFYGHVGAGMWQPAVNVIGCFTVACLAVKYGTKNITRSDCIFFVMGLLAIPLWVMTKNPLWSVMIAAFINGLAFWPTLRKSWHRPEGEAIMTFFMGGVVATLGILAQENRTLYTVFYPMWTGLSDFLFVVVLLYRRRIIKK